MSIETRTAGCMLQLTEVGGRERIGSGFFVAPHLALTAAHVVDSERGGTSSFRVIDSSGRELDLAQAPTVGRYDLALLRFDRASDDCVLFGEGLRVGDQVWTEGFVAKSGGMRRTPVLCSYEGEAVEKPYDGSEAMTLLSFNGGLVSPGMSGGPVLNLNSERVCGVMVRSRDPQQPLGGLAVPIRFALAAFPELMVAQAAFHRDHPEWREHGLVLPTGDLDEDAILKQVATFPPGPGVPLPDVPTAIVDLFLDAGVDTSQEILNRANYLRISVERPKPSRPHTLTVDAPHAERVGCHAFWQIVWPKAAPRGPRMLAALLYAAPPGAMRGREDVVLGFLGRLRSHPVL